MIFEKFIPRILAVLLAAALCFGFVPEVFAMEGAEENAETPEQTETEEEPKITSGTCGAGLSWNFSGGTLTISGSGEMTNFPESTMAPWYGFREEILRVVLPEGMTSVGNLAFYECKNITAVTIPDSVTRIGKYAFAYCSGMQILNLGSGIRTIEDSAFSDCYAVTALRLPSSLQKIGIKAFNRLENITAVTVPSSVTSIGVSAFAYCKNLVSATINANISELPEYLFYGCEKLSKVNLPDGLSDMGDYSFHGCGNLSTVYYEGENLSPEEIQEKIGGETTVSQEESSDSASGGVVMDNGDGTYTAEDTTVKEGEDSTVSATTETTVSPEEGIIGSGETDVTVNIDGDKGWDEAESALEDILNEHGKNEDGSEKHVNINIFLQNSEEIDPGFIESVAGKDVTVTVTTENGSVWVVNGKDINTAELSGNYSLAYVIEAGSPELCEKLGTGTCFVLRFLAPAEINAEVLIRIGTNYARQYATLFLEGKEKEKLQNVVVDGEGYAHFYLGSVTDKKEYYIAINVSGASENAIVPQNMLAEFGNPEYIEPVRYEITGRTSSWGMNLGQVMSILAVVMVSVIIVVGAVMFFWNKQRLKNGYVPDLDEEET